MVRLTAAAFILAALADSITMLGLPPGSETNALAAAAPLPAVFVKLLATGVILALPLLRWRLVVYTLGTLAWGYGTLCNLAVS